MSAKGICHLRSWRIAALMLGLLVAIPTTIVRAQSDQADVSTEAAVEAAEETLETEVDEAPVDDSANADSAAEIGTSAAEVAAEDDAEVEADEVDAGIAAEGEAEAATEDDSRLPEVVTAPASKATSPATSPPSGGSGNSTALLLGITVVALLVLPVIIGNFLGKRLRMPDHAWKISLVLGTLAASSVIVAFAIVNNGFKFGPDLAGGITLIYELAEGQQIASDDGSTPSQAAASGELNMQKTIAILKRRIDPTGTREVTIREYGPAIEVIIPKTGPDALEYVKQRITQLGQLEFRITADPDSPNQRERNIIEQAELLPPSQKNVMIGGRKEAEWVGYAEEEFGPIDQRDERVVKRMAGDTPEALVLMDQWDVTGEYLNSVRKGVDDRGGPAVNFSFNSQGARRFQQLTSKNTPDPATGAVRFLGIVLDKRLLSAPSIRETISTNGQISGSAMKEEEVDNVVSILQEGSLPLRLNREPISEEVISPTLGAVTIEKGKLAIFWSFIAVIAFMLIFYRFAGFVACMALGFNLLLVLAVMVLIKAAFTLPGLAGLVLTIGMSVDANVLIFERMREEFRHGAALRMGIRNGFDRAMSAIIDSNVTTIISGIALYVIGTDQVKGFAVTLILGILTSMYTAIFCSRLIFEIAERQGWLKSIHMMTLMTQTNFNFLRGRYVAGALSAALIAVGLVAVYSRGTSLLDIDFTGGSSVTFALNEAEKMPISEVRETLVGSDLTDKNLLVVQRGESETRYTVDTSEQSVERVKDVVQETFGNKLQTYSVNISNVEPFTDGEFAGTKATLTINEGAGYELDDGLSYDALMDRLKLVLQEQGDQNVVPTISSPAYTSGSSARIKTWEVRLGSMDQSTAQAVLDQFKQDLEQTPMFPLANMIGGRVSGNMQIVAGEAIFFSMLGIIAYLWLRFQKVSYGLAAASALVHDVLVTIGMLAISAYVVNLAPGLASALKLDSFQINLTIVAAILTIMGFSLNDTIVIFDRIREVRGKRPNITPEIVNLSMNQTLSRTILTSLTVFIVVVILYFFGGDGIHGFAFSFLVGVIAGTYSTIYVASPMLVWLSGARSDPESVTS